MKSPVLQTLFLCLLPFFLSAQQLDYPDWVKRKHFAHETCGHEKCLAKAKAENPAITEILKQNNEEIAAWIAQQRAAQANGAEFMPAVVTVPVVVHLVYQNADETLTDAEVQQMVEDMSTDFRYLNGDAGNAPQEFQDVAADVEVDFCLAKRDPQGQPSNGITRTLTGVQFFTLNDEIKHSNQGGKDAWNTSKYLNIWVGKLQTVGGYATLPGTAGPQDDGVVVSLDVLQDPDYLGKGHRVAVHETGHWFNLEHVFGLGPCDDIGDKVDDTPTQLLATGGCPDEYPFLPDEDIQLAQMIEDLFGFPCPYDLEGHMYPNYMDYTNPACMNMFTAGQKERMLAAINTQRAGLLTSDGCVPPTNLPMLEANLEALLSPSGEVCPGSVTAAVYVRNLGENDLNSLTFNIEVNGQPTSFDWTGTLATGEATAIEITTTASANVGNNNITVSITSVNGTVDGNTANNQKSGTFNVYNGSYASSVEEGFEGTFPPAGWQYTGGGGNATDWIKSNDVAAVGNSSMKGNNWASSAILFGPDFNYIYLPRIDLAGANNPVLTFDLAYKLTYFANPDYSEIYPDIGDEMAVEISVDCGHSFHPIFQAETEELATVTDTIVVPDGQPGPALGEQVPTQADFKNIQLSLADYVGEKLIIRFLNVGWSQPIYVDNINLSADQSLAANFDALTAQTICEGGEVDFDFTGAGAATWSWTFEGGTPSTSTEENPLVTYSQAGVYDVELTISDGTNENTVTKTEFITVVPLPSAVITQNNPASSPSANDGSVQAEVFGGLPPYTFELLPDNLTNSTGFFDNLPIGDYSIAIYNDDTQCFVEVPFTIDVASATSELERQLSQIAISPNPNGGRFEVFFAKPFSKKTELSLLDVTGREVKSETVPANQFYKKTWDVVGLPAGMYFLKIRMEGDVVAKKVVVR